jgi:hypothetical protein
MPCPKSLMQLHPRETVIYDSGAVIVNQARTQIRTKNQFLSVLSVVRSRVNICV